MSKGTITLTNQSNALIGLDTSFINEISAGDMIVSVVGGVTYTLPVKSIESDTSLTLIKNYDGPTQSNIAWVAVPRDTLSQITAQLSAEAAKAIRGLNYDKSNWQLVFSELDDVVITLPDGSTFNGPSWLKITNLLNDIDIEKLFEISKSVESNANIASNAATTATEQASLASESANKAEESAVLSANSASIASKNSEIAIDKAGIATAKADEAARYASSYRFRVGEIITSAFRKDDLGLGWYLANGDKYDINSLQGQTLKSLPESYKSDWGIIETGGYINLPNVFDPTTGYGYFPRFVDGMSRQVGQVQSDAIQNITGSINFRNSSGNNGISFSATGAVTRMLNEGSGPAQTQLASSSGGSDIFYFDASRVVPTADENRPSNIGFTPAIYLGV